MSILKTLNTRSKNNKGFTLVELIIVVAVIMILMAVIAPQYTRYVERSRQSNDLQIATTIMDAAVIAISDPQNEIPSNAFIRIAWLTAGSGVDIVIANSAYGSNIKDIYHSSGVLLSENLENVIEEIVSGQNSSGAESEAGRHQNFIFSVDADTGKILVAGENPNPASNGWNQGSYKWVEEIGVRAELTDSFYFYY